MQYPTILEYVKAIQDAGNNLDKLAHLTPVLDDHGEPYHISGAFAVVFKMQDKSTGKYYALKCFTKEQEGRADAYRQIAEELDMVEYPYIIFVKYMEKEVCVDCQCEEDKFPVLLMDWVDGDTMEAYIAANYHNQSSMSMLCYRFGKMAAWLRTQSFAHGDLKSGNIIVRPDGSLALVDYDGMFVPSMKGRKSPTKGTKNFSHPLRTVDDFDETIDDFSLASIALSLKAISLSSTLLDLYGNSGRLLFSEEDYRNPSKSKVISTLQELMCNKDLCTLYSLFMLALARKDLSLCSYRLFVGEKPIQPQSIEDLSTKATEEELKDAYIDEWGVKYSKDGRKLLKSPTTLSGTYSIKKTTEIICDRAFFDCLNLTSISIPNSVKDIGEWAFAGCSLLSSIDIPNSVNSIGNIAFAACLSLEYISIPESVISLNGNSFCDWDGELECLSANFIYEDDVLFNKDKSEIISFRNQEIESYIIPDSVTSIGDGAFGCCSSLSSLVIPDSVVNIKGNPFYFWKGKLECLSASFIYEDNVLFNMDKSKLISFRNQEAKSFIIPNGVVCIGKYAFSDCSSLISISVPKSVTSIEDGAFDGCISLSSIAISDSITSISAWTFDGCKSLRSLVIPDSVTSIGNEAFRGCSSLCSLVIPDSVTSIGDGAFDGCSSLRSLVVSDSVTSIGDGAFSSCSSLRSLVIPDSVVNIKGNPFCYWKGKLECLSASFIYEDNVLFNMDKSKLISFRNQEAKSFIIPDGVKSIGKCAFVDCYSLVSISIPNSVTNIGDGAFDGCSSLSNLVIPNSVTSIGDGAFWGCSSLRSLVIPNSVTSIGAWAFSGCKSLSNITIPDSLTSIGAWAFEGCSSLCSLVISNSVTSIDACVFSGCKSLSNITIPDSVTSIGAWAFEGCSSLRSLVIPNSVTSIGNSAFEGCSSLSSLVIPDSVTSIGDSAFAGCKSLSNIIIPDSVTSIGDSAFEDCTSLSSLVIPDGVTSIGAWTFKGCSSLSSLAIPDSVTCIGFGAFEGCSSLRDLVIPNSVNDIEDRAFEGCNFPDNLIQELSSRFGDKIFE